MSDFNPGQLVECVDDGFRFIPTEPSGLKKPRRGMVYRIRSIEVWPVRERGCDVQFIRLDEIRNPLFSTKNFGMQEPVFEASAFKPLSDSRLDVFHKIEASIWRTPA
jgi:hypothetical protein